MVEPHTHTLPLFFLFFFFLGSGGPREAREIQETQGQIETREVRCVRGCAELPSTKKDKADGAETNAMRREIYR